VESDGYDEEKFPGSRFHVAIPLRLDKGQAIELGIEVKTQIS
jgi:hypothetical protein